MEINLKGKTALVCGSTQGIGKASALQLAECGASVIMLARNEDKLKEVLTLLKPSADGSHKYYIADFSNPDSLRETLRNVKESVDIILNNTGGPPPGPAKDATPEQYLEAFKQHLICNHIIVQHFLKGMQERKWGRIINVISTSVKAPLKNLGVSNTVRAAVGNWSKTLSNEVAPYGITVNNILPGATSTERLSNIIKANALKRNLPEEEIKKEMLHEIPAARFADPREPAYAVAFLASDYAAYINGVNIPVDGGRTPNL
jgi:3-oxoacyl-[acyl-carrier protein] reductase